MCGKVNSHKFVVSEVHSYEDRERSLYLGDSSFCGYNHEIQRAAVYSKSLNEALSMRNSVFYFFPQL